MIFKPSILRRQILKQPSWSRTCSNQTWKSLNQNANLKRRKKVSNCSTARRPKLTNNKVILLLSTLRLFWSRSKKRKILFSERLRYRVSSFRTCKLRSKNRRKRLSRYNASQKNSMALRNSWPLSMWNRVTLTTWNNPLPIEPVSLLKGSRKNKGWLLVRMLASKKAKVLLNKRCGILKLS